jgi:CrcB protein
MLGTLSQIAIGGALGATSRYLVGLGAARILGSSFPWGTLLVNVVGSFLMGILAIFVVQSEARAAPFLLTGLLGGFTTFSAFSLDTLNLIERGQTWAALAYVFASVAFSLVAIVAGLALARSTL